MRSISDAFVARLKGDGSIMEVIRWAADRARAAERKRAKRPTDGAIMKKWAAATQLQSSFEAVLKAHLGEKMTRLDAALRAVRALDARDAKGGR